MFATASGIQGSQIWKGASPSRPLVAISTVHAVLEETLSYTTISEELRIAWKVPEVAIARVLAREVNAHIKALVHHLEAVGIQAVGLQDALLVHTVYCWQPGWV